MDKESNNGIHMEDRLLAGAVMGYIKAISGNGLAELRPDTIIGTNKKLELMEV